jgi:N-acetylmuramoyl-L-alanine amidase
VRTINKVILHCSDTIEGAHINVDTIRQWHEARGWDDIGYHYVIYLDGTIHKGRDLDIVGAHCRGNNKDSIGVCYIGGRSGKENKPADTMTAQQELGWLQLWYALKTLFGNIKLHGHNEFSEKACPSFDVQEKYKFLINE